MEKNKKTLRRFLGIFLTLVLALAMMPLSAFADPADAADASGWGESIYVLGTRVTDKNCHDVLGDGGSVVYDRSSRTLTLKNTTLDLANYHSDATENNTVYGIDTFRGCSIVLIGNNKIISTAQQFTEDKEYVYGITATDELNISGGGSLDIEIYTADNGIKSFYGIDSSRNLILDNIALSITMTGTGNNTGFFSGFRGFHLKNNADVKVSSQGTYGRAVYDTSFGGSSIEDGSHITMVSDNKAYQNTILSASMTEQGAYVNTEPTEAGAQEWDKTTPLSQYKYVSMPVSSGGRGWHDNVYILGNLITEENCDDVLGDGGSVKYNFDEKALTLTDAVLDLSNYVDPAPENNYVAGINSFGPIDIRLDGDNVITSGTGGYADGKEYVFGIAAEDAMTISGSGFLNITIDTGIEGIRYWGIDSSRSLTVDCTFLLVGMLGNSGGERESIGIDTFWNGLAVENEASVIVLAEGENSTALYDSSFGKTSVADGASLELVSDGHAMQYISLSEALIEQGALVNTEATMQNAYVWDKTTRLSEYKYVRFPMPETLDKATITLSSTEFTYNGKVQKPDVTVEYQGNKLTEGEDYYLLWSDVDSENAGEYIVTAVAVGRKYIGSVDASYKIKKADSTIKVADKKVTYNGKPAEAGKVTVTGSTGEVTVRYYTDSACKEKVSPSKVKNAGTYYVKATVAADANYNSATSKPAKLTIQKAEQEVKSVTPTSKTVKAGKSFTLKAKATKENGTAAFTKAAGDSKIKVSKDGKVTVKKGLKAGTYKLKVKVKIAATKNYKATKTVTKTIKITVK